MHVRIAMCTLVLLFPLPLVAQDTGETEKAFANDKRVVEPVKKENRLMDLMAGGSEGTNKTVHEDTPGGTLSNSGSEGVTVDEAEEKEKDLPYLDEDQDE